MRCMYFSKCVSFTCVRLSVGHPRHWVCISIIDTCRVILELYIET